MDGLNLCASSRDRNDVDFDMKASLLEIYRTVKSQQANQQMQQQQMVDVATSLKNLMEAQKEVAYDVGKVVKMQVEPVFSSLELLRCRTQAHHVDSYKRDDEGEIERAIKKHLDPVRSHLVGLRELLDQKTVDGTRSSDKQPLAPNSTNKQPTSDNSRQAPFTEDVQVCLRQELQAIEKLVAACIEEKLTLIEEKLKQVQETSKCGKSEFHEQILGKLGELHEHVGHSMSSAQMPQRGMSFDTSHGVLTRLSSRNNLHSVSHGQHGQKQDTCELEGQDEMLTKPTTPLNDSTKDLQIARVSKTPKIKPGAQNNKNHVSITPKDSSAISSVFFIDNDLQSKPYHTEDHYKDFGICQSIARSFQFEALTAIVVFANAAYIGIESDKNDAPNIYNSDWGFIAISHFFCIFFTTELTIRYLAFNFTSEAFRDGWFVFDLFLVITNILELWITMPLLLIISGDGVKIPTHPLRLLRLAKILRMGRLMRVFPELVTMILGLVRSLRAILSTLVLLLGMMYVWAIFLHGLMKSEQEANEELKKAYDFDFSTMTHCLWTLLMDGVLQLDNAALVMTTLIWDDRFKVVVAGIAFTFFSLLSSLLILQMLIGVMCDVVAQVGAEQRKNKAIQIMKHELLDELTKRNDGDGRITKAEFDACMASESSIAVFTHLKINPMFFCEMASLYYIDGDSVPVIRLLELLMLCQGEGHVTVDLLAIVISFLNNELLDMEIRIVGHVENLLERYRSKPIDLRNAAHAFV